MAVSLFPSFPPHSRAVRLVVANTTERADDLVLHLSATERFPDTGRWKIRYAVETVDDRGTHLRDPETSPVRDVEDKRQLDFDVVVPKNRDGFFKSIVSFAAQKNAVPTDGHLTFHWQVAGGRVIPLTENQWFRAAPNALQAVKL